MAAWHEFGRTDAHGLCLETAHGVAEIEMGYTDHQVRVFVLRRNGHNPRPRAFHDLDEAKHWAEAQLQ
jgi:hypothetical protein